MAKVIFTPNAKANYRIALDYYVDAGTRVAKGFDAELFKTLDFISNLPEASSLVDDRHRYRSLKRYSYGVVYLYDGSDVIVIAIPHHRQLPGDWLQTD